jgi:hypothetical protein
MTCRGPDGGPGRGARHLFGRGSGRCHATVGAANAIFWYFDTITCSSPIKPACGATSVPATAAMARKAINNLTMEITPVMSLVASITKGKDFRSALNASAQFDSNRQACLNEPSTKVALCGCRQLDFCERIATIGGKSDWRDQAGKNGTPALCAASAASRHMLSESLPSLLPSQGVAAGQPARSEQRTFPVDADSAVQATRGA